MKASEYMTGKTPVPQKQRTFTGDHLTTIIKSLVTLGIVFLLLQTGKWFVEFMIDHQPVTPSQEQVDSAMVNFVKADTIIIPIEYKYADSHFESNGDTTYWFYRASTFAGSSSSVISFPYSHFNFDAAMEKLKRKGNKNIFIEYFQQISKASFQSYLIYAKKD